MSTSFVGDRPPQIPLPLRSGSAASLSNPTSPASLSHHCPPPAAFVPPLVSLELRVRWLEALVSGLDNRRGGKVQAEVNQKEAKGLVRMTQDVQTELDEILEANDSLRRFMNTCVSYHSPISVLMI